MKHSSAPAYSMGLKYPAEPITTDKLAPSPNTYTVRPEAIQVPCTKFSQATRSISEGKSEVPGPGSYYISTFVDQVISKKSKIVHSTKEKREKSKIDSPGPGSFNPQVQHKSLSFSMGNKTYSTGQPEEYKVSPDNYSPNYASIEAVKGITFTKGQREAESIDLKPGPGHYDISYFKDSPKYSFPSQERGNTKKLNNPSPFEYSIPSFTDDRFKGITIVPKREPKRNDEWVPGPGSYNVKLPTILPTYSIGKGKRPELILSQNNPGPGEYSPKGQRSPPKSIGNGKRPSINTESFVPGPGTYDFSTYTLSGPKYSLVPRREALTKTTVVPGPAHYSPDFKTLKGKAYSAAMGNSERKFEEDLKAVPGPGTYNLDALNDSPSWTFKKGRKANDLSESPGPGHYEFLVSVPDVPKYLKNK